MVRRCAALGFRHEALLYAGERELVRSALRFLREGIAREEPALVALAPERIALLREALGPADAAHVRFADMTRIGANPARIIPAWAEFAHEAGRGGRPLRGIGEPIHAGRSTAELFECHRHESLLNLAFADAADFHLLCPYDTSMLAPTVVRDAHRTHPFVRVGDTARASRAFHGLEAAAEPCSAPLPPAPPEAQTIPVMPAGLAALRAAVARRAQRAGLPKRRREDLVLAIDELATNSIRHGGGAGTLLIWETLAAIVCEVADAGRIVHPLAGRVAPRPGQLGGYGLWLVNQLCDLVEQRTLPHGNVVRVWMRRD